MNKQTIRWRIIKCKGKENPFNRLQDSQTSNKIILFTEIKTSYNCYHVPDTEDIEAMGIRIQIEEKKD